MRVLRLFLWFVVGLLFGGWVSLAHADYWFKSNSVTMGPMSASEACIAVWAGRTDIYKHVISAGDLNRAETYTTGGLHGDGGVSCKFGSPGRCPDCVVQNVDRYACPSGQDVQVPTINCVASAPKCQSPANAQLGSWYSINYPVVSGVTFCVNNCNAYAGPTRNRSGGTAQVQMFVNGAGGAASTCTVGGSQTVPNAVSDPTDLTPPPCPPGAGSYTSPGGVVMCTSPTTPNATVPPVVTKQGGTTTYPDGSTSTVTTINTCTGDGACSTSTTTVVTGTNGGTTTGQAGTPGTTTSTVTKPSSDTSDFCAKNPNLQLCKGGLNEEATQKKIADDLHSLTNPGALNDDGLKIQSKFSQTAEILAEDKKAFDGVGGVVDPTAEKKSAWSQAMSDGWFDPIPQTGCSPFVWNIAGQEISLDICPTAERISKVGGYAMWFVLVIGVFVMVTGGRSTTEA